MKQTSRKNEKKQPAAPKPVPAPGAANHPAPPPPRSGPEVRPENNTGTQEITRAAEGRPGSFGIDDY